MANGYFDYPVPFTNELRELYIEPYDFSKETKDAVMYLYEHARFKWRKVFVENYKSGDEVAMLRIAYLQIRYFLDHPQQFGGALENIYPQLYVGMFKKFLGTVRKYKRFTDETYIKIPMQMQVFKARFIDRFVDEIENGELIYHSDDLVKRRDGVGLRERKVGYSERDLRYYETLA